MFEKSISNILFLIKSYIFEIMSINNTVFFDHTDALGELRSKNSTLDSKLNFVQEKNLVLELKLKNLEEKLTELENALQKYEDEHKKWNETKWWKKLFFQLYIMINLIFVTLDKKNNVYLWLDEPKRESEADIYKGQYLYLNSVRYKEIAELVKKSSLTWNSEPVVFEI